MSRDSGTIAGGTGTSSAALTASPAQPTAPRDLRRLHSTELLAGGREAVIVHGQDEYRLRVTSNGKLILTK